MKKRQRSNDSGADRACSRQDCCGRFTDALLRAEEVQCRRCRRVVAALFFAALLLMGNIGYVVVTRHSPFSSLADTAGWETEAFDLPGATTPARRFPRATADGSLRQPARAVTAGHTLISHWPIPTRYR